MSLELGCMTSKWTHQLEVKQKSTAAKYFRALSYGLSGYGLYNYVRTQVRRSRILTSSSSTGVQRHAYGHVYRHGTDRCIDRCIDSCIDNCIDRCIDRCTDRCTDMCIDMCAEMCIDRCVDMCIDTCTDICIDMYIDRV